MEKTSKSQQRHPADHRVWPNPRKRQEIRAETLEDGVTPLRNLCWSSALPEFHILLVKNVSVKQRKKLDFESFEAKKGH